MTNTTTPFHTLRFTGQYGGGKNCDCREAYFNPDELINDPRINFLVSQNEIREKIDAASGIVRSQTKFILLLVIFMVIVCQVASIPFRMLEVASSTCNTNNFCNATQTSLYCPDDACNYYCCPIEHQGGPKATSLEGAGCTANFTERKLYLKEFKNEYYITEESECWCDHMMDEHDYDDNERYDRLLKERRKKKGESSNYEEKKCKGRVFMSGNVKRNPGNMWLLALAIPLVLVSIILTFSLIIWIKNRNAKKMKELFRSWEAKQIYTTYIRGGKHSPAWLCFVVKGQYLQQQQGNIQIVQPYQQGAMMQQGQVMMVQQQPNQVQGQVMMVQQQPHQVQGQVMMVQQPNQTQGVSQFQNQQQGLVVQPIQQYQVRPVVTNQASNANAVHKI